ncbi:hypothetical protein Q6348_06620 [Isoptericola sp. b441]|uniref:DUF7715 domain-containing protein n=1 Tax=Actinotalea lenta TaxID=3064654 RepID=A0ABT9D9D5_9CELL|nr:MULTISPECIES: hypothetical protein [unclassified Isoptericola]MDO8106869.1 hypothetical protein [Isoptericola sp. b441]MDO8121421.1 hypothetical protein [Isoptericola sp. b490]
MKVLTATEATQGTRADDYSWTTPGELVMFGAVCASDLRGTGQPCGCGRAFAGLHSARATTTAEVVESAMSLDDLVLAFRDSLTCGGWLDDLPPQDAAELVQLSVMEMLVVADRFPAGTVIGTHLGSQYVRQEAGAR